MADSMEHSEKNEETLVEKITEKFHHLDDSSSSSSDSDSDKHKEQEPEQEQEQEQNSSSSVKDKFSRLFGTEKPVHQVFGGGKPADVFLWRNKKISAAVLGSATGIWVVFELLEYHLLTFVCHLLILAIAVLFLLSNVAAIFNKSPPRIPDVHLSEEPFIQVAQCLRFEINQALSVLRDIASGRDLKRFLVVIAGLWFFSVIGSFCNFLTLFYIAFVLLHTVPVLYEKYDDKIDAFVEKASIEIKKQYAVFEDKVLSKIPRGPFKDKKKA